MEYIHFGPGVAAASRPAAGSPGWRRDRRRSVAWTLPLNALATIRRAPRSVYKSRSTSSSNVSSAQRQHPFDARMEVGTSLTFDLQRLKSGQIEDDAHHRISEPWAWALLLWDWSLRMALDARLDVSAWLRRFALAAKPFPSRRAGCPLFHLGRRARRMRSSISRPVRTHLAVGKTPAEAAGLHRSDGFR